MPGKEELEQLLKAWAGHSSPRIVGLVQQVLWTELRNEYQILVDEWTTEHTFDADDALALFDRAVKNLKGDR